MKKSNYMVAARLSKCPTQDLFPFDGWPLRILNPFERCVPEVDPQREDEAE